MRWVPRPSESSSTEIIGRPPAQPSILKAFGRIHLFPRPTPQHANALARQFADSANNLANAKRRRPRWPKQKPWQFTLLPFQVPVGAQRMWRMLRKRAARPFHSIRTSCPGHLLQRASTLFPGSEPQQVETSHADIDHSSSGRIRSDPKLVALSPSWLPRDRPNLPMAASTLWFSTAR